MALARAAAIGRRAARQAAGRVATAMRRPALPSADDRLFVTIADLGAVLAPAERLRTVYPRYIETQATAGPEGLAIVPFRAGTPYESEDLIYLAERPEQFFARCTRVVRHFARHMHQRALARRRRDHAAVPAGMARSLAQRRSLVRPADRATASAEKLAAQRPRYSKFPVSPGGSGQVHIQNWHFKNVRSTPLLIIDEYDADEFIA